MTNIETLRFLPSFPQTSSQWKLLCG